MTSAAGEISDVVEADYEIVGHAGVRHAVAPPPPPAPAGVSVLGPAVPEPTARLLAPAGSGFWIGGGLAAMAAFWLSGGHALLAPALAREEAAPLRVAHFASRVEEGAAGPLLSVEGELANDGRAARLVPPFAIEITTRQGAVMRYVVDSGGRPVAAGATHRFSSRIAVPATPIETVTIRLDPVSGERG